MGDCLEELGEVTKKRLMVHQSLFICTVKDFGIKDRLIFWFVESGCVKFALLSKFLWVVV